MSKVIKSALMIGLAAVGVAQVMSQQKPRPQPARAESQPSVRTGPAQSRAPGPVQTAPLASPPGQVLLEPGRHGHYEARVETRGGAVRMMVDTGASLVAFTAEDARTLGLYPRSDAAKIGVSTANGMTTATRMMVDSLRIGSVVVNDVEVLIMEPGASNTSLLGMSFLRKLKGYEVANGRLVLRQ